MNQYVTANTIKELREKNKMTQAELASILNVSDKTISKWETGRGYPDISLLEPLAKTFNISVNELLSGDAIDNKNISAKISKSNLYVCPICGNVIYSIGEVSTSCHGILLKPLVSEIPDNNHEFVLEIIEDEYYLQIKHEMTKEHYISFVASTSFDSVNIIKLYPESNAEARIKVRGVNKIYFYCNKDGLFCFNPKKITLK